MVLLTFNGGDGIDKDIAQLHLSLFSADIERPTLFYPH
jgi:hypothetical protein